MSFHWKFEVDEDAVFVSCDLEVELEAQIDMWQLMFDVHTFHPCC